ncbi:tyrosinase cofactor [Streptomyces sp. H10-C2]|uniref:apotyrosinase chaperone MelC1 n=1 Tax=unclassified Streptomyces TaxID=2593676 RepID=UPI0024BA421A|nr:MULTISPECIES: tyrosinase cofactor [unclassified Streptomyces]MDJ0346191.1 tyrosinase cofactor [Streptomyces sp. PH10-H1]MDJ0371142.1 tyrosinase cofactor [Streptomyces sp. H10-C2]
MSDLTRRRVLRRGAMAVAGAAFTATALSTPVALAARRGDEPEAGGARSAGSGGPAAFDEIYQGRRIRGQATHGGGHHHGGPGYAVLIDGKELHVMQNADGTWISVINHYETFTSPRTVARAAVKELQGATLVPMS